MSTQHEDAIALTIATIAEAIRELGSVPSGHLYAQLCGSIDLSSYQAAIGILERAKLVRSEHYVLTWIGPHKRT